MANRSFVDGSKRGRRVLSIPWGSFAETQAVLVSLVLTGGFSVYAGVDRNQHLK
jgi:hypothetical protein